MIFGERDPGLGERFARAAPVKPGGSDEAVDRTPDHAFDQGAAIGDAGSRFGARQAQELALTGGEKTRADAIRRPGVLRLVAMGETVEQDLNTLVSP